MKVSHHLHKTCKPKIKKASGGAVPPAAGFKKGGEVEKKTSRKKLAIGGVAKIRHDQYK